MNIGNAIKEIRKRKGISQKDLAKKIGMSANNLCSIEKEKSFPSMENIKKICSSLEVPESVLLLFSITDEDVPEHKRKVFHYLADPLKNYIIE